MQKHGMEAYCEAAPADFFGLEPAKISPRPGIVVLNPPFGIRLGSVRQRHHFYHEIAAKLSKDFKQWRAAVLLPDRQLAASFPSAFKPRRIILGGLNLTLLTGRIK